MTIHLPEEVENSLNAAVLSGRFASLDAAMTKAAYLLLQELNREARPAAPAGAKAGPGSIGAMRDAADGLDEIVAGAIDQRQQQGTATPPSATAPTYKPIWEVAAEIRKSIPAEEWAKLPIDGARQLDHYIYGTPKRPPS